MSGFRIADIFAGFRVDVDKKSVSGVDSIIGGLKKAAAAVLALGAAFELKRTIGEVADLGDKLDEMSQKTGASVEDIQEFGYAAGQAGVGIDEVGGTIGKLSNAMYMAAQGSKQQADAFHRMGVSVKDAHGKLRPALDVIGDIGDHFASMPDGTEKSALAMQVFGRSGRNLIPVLNQGRKKLAELSQEFKDSGAEISGADAEALGKYNDEVGLLHTQWQGVKVTLVTALLPTLREVIKGFGAWLKANKEIVKTRVRQFAEGLAIALKTLGRVLSVVIDAVAYLAENWQVALAAAAGLTAATILLGDVSVVAALRAAAAWVAAALPLIAVGALITAAILLVQELYSWFKGGDSVVRDWLVPAAHAAIEKVRAEFSAFLDWLNGKSPVGSDVGGAAAGATGYRQKQRAAAYERNSAYVKGKNKVYGDIGANRTMQDVLDANKTDLSGAENLFSDDVHYGQQAYSLGGVAKTASVITQSTGINVYIQRASPEEIDAAVARMKEATEKSFRGMLKESYDATVGGK